MCWIETELGMCVAIKMRMREENKCKIASINRMTRAKKQLERRDKHA